MRTIRKTIFVVTAVWGGSAGAVELVAEGVDYAQLGAILGYVASDYASAVGPAGVISQQELSEQRGFLADALATARALPASNPEAAELQALLGAAGEDAARAAAPDAVVPKVSQALALLEQHHDLGRTPKSTPVFARGRELFAEGCADCHALDGSGQTSLHLSTRPPDVRDPAQAGQLSPARVYAAVSYGVPGTAMPAFSQAYTPADRWNLSFYLLALAHPAPAAAPDLKALPVSEPVFEPSDQPQQAPRAAGSGDPRPPALRLADLAARSDDGLRADLKQTGLSGAAVEAALGELRRAAPYAATAPTNLLSESRRQIADASAKAKAGDLAAAKHAAIAAYLDDFEPFEPALRAKDASLVAALERAFSALRAGLDSGAPAPRLEVLATDLNRLLLKAEDALASGSASVSFAAALAIALREGLEATLLLSALLALAAKSGRRRARTAVHLGWSGALLAGVLTWLLSGALLAHSGQNRELTEGVTVLLTAALLLGASHWILAQASAKKLVSFLSRRAALVQGAGWGLGGLAFLAIYREMFEIVVFYRGLLLQAPDQGGAVLAGVAVGLVLLGAVVVVFQRVVGRRLQPRPLLITCGALLCGLSIVMVGEGIRALQEAGVVGQSLLNLPEVPQLGLFATAQGLLAQGAVLLGLAGSLAFTLARPAPAAKTSKPSEPAAPLAAGHRL